MFLRSRSMSGPTVSGWFEQANQGKYYASYATMQATCVDWVNAYHLDNALQLDKVYREGGIMHGKRNWIAGYTQEFNQKPGDFLASNVNPAFSSPPSGAFKDINKVIASHHPGEPAVALPVFLFELKDVPDMLKHAFGRARDLNRVARSDRHQDVMKYLKSSKGRSEDWLNWNFGWAPLLSDLITIFDLSEELVKRARQIKRAKRGFIRKKSNIGTWSNTYGPTRVSYNSVGFGLYADMVVSETHKRWVSSKWSVSQEMFHAASDLRNLQLLKAIAGLDISLTHAWDAMPWTWMVDWFTGLGDIIHAQQNRFGIGFQSACLMNHRTLQATASPYGMPNWFTASTYRLTRESKYRTPVAPSLLNLGINILNPKQLATLGSLVVTRAKGSSRF